jgi:hypothetical protein
MNGEELYRIWAPAGTTWAAWVKPALFTAIECAETGRAAPKADLSWFHAVEDPVAIVLDLAGEYSLQIGTALAEQYGFQPVSMINVPPPPTQDKNSWECCVVDMRALIRELCTDTATLQHLTFAANAQPVFLLDAARMSGNQPADDQLFDNRWAIFKYDFPTASFLHTKGIHQVLLVQEREVQPQDDLAEALMAWEQDGIVVFSQQLYRAQAAERIKVRRPPWYKFLWNRLPWVRRFTKGFVAGFGPHGPGARLG